MLKESDNSLLGYAADQDTCLSGVNVPNLNSSYVNGLIKHNENLR